MENDKLCIIYNEHSKTEQGTITFTAMSAISLQSTYHWGLIRGSTMSLDRLP